MYILANLELKQELLKLYYNLPSQGYPGIFGTMANIQRYFWWSGIHAFVKGYIQGYTLC